MSIFLDFQLKIMLVTMFPAVLAGYSEGFLSGFMLFLLLFLLPQPIYFYLYKDEIARSIRERKRRRIQ